jgi:ATP-dependent helicase HepA
MVTGAMDLVLSSEKGNSSFGVFPNPEDRTLLLEAFLILETVASPELHVDRFLSATPVRRVVDHKGRDVTEQCPENALSSSLRKGSPFKLIDTPNLKQKVIPAMVQAALDHARQQGQTIIQHSLRDMNRLLDHEIERLKTLQAINDHVHPREIDLLQSQQQDLARAITQARVRLDSVRLIWKGDPQALS